MSQISPITTANPITLQVITNSLYSIADEMMAALIRTSFSTNIKDRRDCSGAIFTPQGEVVAQAEIGTPLHLGVMLPTVTTALKAIPIRELEPGDDIMINTPYPEGPGHLNDLSIISPVFHEGEVVAVLANMAHHVDVGGFAPGSMPFGVWEHYQEGLQVPPVKISRRNRLQEDLFLVLSRNVRTPVEFRGDLTAQIAANNVGEKRLQSLFQKHGKDSLRFYMQELMNYSERRIRSAISRLPTGSHTGSDVLEGDSLTQDPIRIRVRLIIEEDHLTADFSQTDAQVMGPLNCRPPSAKACFYYVVKALLDPGLPPNSGAFRPLRVVTKPGTLLHVDYPGALCNANIITTQRVVDSLMKAFSSVLPARVGAACSGTMNLFNIGGIDPRTHQLYNYIETYGGGQGGLPDRDGTSGVQTHMTNTRNAPVEVMESTYPLFIRRYGLIPESAGAGKFRGGFGMSREIEIQSERTTLTVSSDRFQERPWGLCGGKGARPGSCTILHPDGSREELPSKISRPIGRNDCLISITPGGGGWGDPLERDPESVRHDVIEELISRQTASDAYGVILEDDLRVDRSATQCRRSFLKRSHP